MYTENDFTLSVLDIYNNVYCIQCFGYEHHIDYIKFVLNSKTHIDISSIVLCLNGVELPDHKTFYECGINENSILRMFFRIRTGFALGF